jgi:predicted secreted protein
VSLRGRKGVRRKPVFGAAAKAAISGQREYSLSARGHVEASDPLAKLFTAFETEGSIACSIQIGEAAGATDAGDLAGNMILSDLEVTGDAEGEWDWSFTAEFDGAVTHTP